MDPQSEELKNLSQRIHQMDAKDKPDAEVSSGRNAGFDFAGTVIGSVILGLLLDRFFGTAPWILVAMVIVGFSSGTYVMVRAAKDTED